MKASLCVEMIGWNEARACADATRLIDLALPGQGRAVVGGNPRATWVAQITGTDPRYGWARTFLPRAIDYSASNSVGSRGVMALYILESGCVYEVCAYRSWRQRERYFCRVDPGSGAIIRVAPEEVRQWIVN